MSDAEWDRLRATFREGGRPMPNIVKRAATDRRRMLLGFAGIYALAGLELAFALPALARAKSSVEAAAPTVVVLGSLAVVAVAHASMRGGFRADGVTPVALLDALATRHAGRRRLMRAMPWLTAAVVVGTIGSAAWAMIAAGRFEPVVAALTAAVSAATVALVWGVIRREGATIDRELREAAEARRLLEEGER